MGGHAVTVGHLSITLSDVRLLEFFRVRGQT